MPSVRLYLVMLMLCAASGVASANEIECGLTQEGVITIDGLLDDWKGVKGVSNSSGSTGDAGFTIRCNYDEEALYLSVEVSDERLIRNKKPGAGDDHVALAFGDKVLEVYPGDTDKKIKASTTWSDGGSTRWVTWVDSLTAKGWAVELAMPFGRVPGGGGKVVRIPFQLDFHDNDKAVATKAETVVTTGEGALVLEEASGLVEQFLADNKLSKKDVTLDVSANLDTEAGNERVVAAGKYVAVFTREYSFIQLPVAKSKDVLEVKVIDLSGQGKASVVGRYIERGGGGSREVLAVWNMGTDGGFNRTFVHELGKQLGESRITSKWELAPRTIVKGKGKKKKVVKAPGYDIVIRPGEAVGFTQETWNESPAEDMLPIVLPWSGTKQEVWRFDGDEYSGGAE
jgi:hypothetical protein